MQRTILIAAFLSFLLFMAAGYWVAVRIGERDLEQETAQTTTVLQKNKTIHADTELVYQYFYTGDKEMQEQKEPAPDFLQGLNREQLQSIYHGWQIILFSPEQVILRCYIEGMSTESYIIGEKEGCLAVFYEDSEKTIHLKEKTELPLSTLPDGTARQIREGLRVTGEENLAKLLADFMS